MANYGTDSMLKVIDCPVLLIQADDVGMGHQMVDTDVEYALSVLSDVSHVKIMGVGHGFDLWTGKTNFYLLGAMMSYLESFR
jgi:pimeloyl-ACP methyl ester carboxylesterase